MTATTAKAVTKPSPSEKLRVRMAAEGYNGYKVMRSQDLETDDDETLMTDALKSRGDRERGCTRNEKQLTAVIVVCLILITLLAVAVGLMYYQKNENDKSSTCASPECVMVAGSMLAKMDLSVSPCDDFYTYACGHKLLDPLIPPEKAKWGTFNEIDRRNSAILKRILDNHNTTYKDQISTAISKAKLYYRTCMNTSVASSDGTLPMLSLIRRLGSWSVTSDAVSGSWRPARWSLEQSLLAANLLNLSPLFAISIDADQKNSSSNVIGFDQGGFTFSDMDNYLINMTSKYHDSFVDFFTGIGVLLGGDVNSTRAKAEKVWQFETALAQLFTKEENRMDITKLYNNMTLQQLNDLMQNMIDLPRLMSSLVGQDVPPEERVIVYAPAYLKNMAQLVLNYDQETLANYMVWQGVYPYVGYLSTPFQLILDKLSQSLEGTTPSALWTTCVSRVGDVFGFAVGALFVQEKFTKTDKEQVEQMIEMIRKTFYNNIQNVDWMDSRTKEKALIKAEAILAKVGYPEFILQPEALDAYYEKMKVTADSEFWNVINASAFLAQKTLEKYGRPADKTRWSMTPQEVNAYYSAEKNQIVFPAGVLQPSIYDPSYPAALNFGSLGMIIAHELTHAFDGLGRRFDEKGNLADWWTNASSNAVNNKIECFINQYNQFSVGDLKVNGKLTISENIADNGGLKAAYRTFHSWLRSHHQPRDLQAARLPGLNMTEDQLLFLSYAQLWCAYYTPEYVISSIHTDKHSLTKFRVNGVLSDMTEFSTAFHCPETATMNPPDKCSLWWSN